MKALIYDGPETLGFREVADPAGQAGELLIRVEAVGICGSDMHGYLGHDDRRPAPLILGHEAAGTIVGGPRDGERVTVNPLVSCGACDACLSGRDNICPDRQLISMPPREGAFAQYVSMPARNLVTVPDDVPFTKAALAEPLAVSWHAIKLARAALGKSHREPRGLAIGGGAIGLGAALCLTAQGITDVTLLEPQEARRQYLREVCGQNAISPDELADDAQFDIVADGVGFAATRETASKHTAPGGVIVHIGLGEATGGLDIRRMTLQEITFIGSYTYTLEDFRETCAVLFDGRLGSLDWIETRPLSDGAAAFRDIRDGQVSAPKIVLRPWP